MKRQTLGVACRAAQGTIVGNDRIREFLLEADWVVDVFPQPPLSVRTFFGRSQAVDISAKGDGVELTHNDQSKVSMSELYLNPANSSLRKFDASQSRCVVCTSPEGSGHAAGCWVAQLTIRRVN